MDRYSDVINEIRLIKSDLNLSVEEIDNRVNSLLGQYKYPLKEGLELVSCFGKCYYVPKAKRDILFDVYDLFLYGDFFDEGLMYKLKVAFFDALHRNYDFFKAEELVNDIFNSELRDHISLYQLGDYYTLTRRYDKAIECLESAITCCDDEFFVLLIEKKIDECKKRSLGKENGGSSPYLPSMDDARVKYCDFLNELGIEVVVPKKKDKAPKKISVEDYPAVDEITEAGFKSFVAFDVETTGLDHSKESIIELSAIRVVDGVVVEEKEFIFSELVHPYKTKISKTIEELTGISNEMVSDAREIWEVFKDFADWLGDDILLGYNCSTFDSKFMVRAGRLSNIILTNKYYDVMKLARSKKHLLSSENLKLVNVAESLGIINPQAHRALADAITTAKVYLALLDI